MVDILRFRNYKYQQNVRGAQIAKLSTCTTVLKVAELQQVCIFILTQSEHGRQWYMEQGRHLCMRIV